MAASFYDISIASYLQTLGAVAGFLDRGISHAVEKKIDPNEIVETRLFADMLPFRFQVYSVAHHSLGAIEGIKKGVFQPPPELPRYDYAGLQKLIAETRAELEKLTHEEVSALEGRDIVFHLRDLKLPFTAENFVLSFSLPNFYFHAATAYDILRVKGVPLGKRDFMGQLRLKR